MRGGGGSRVVGEERGGRLSQGVEIEVFFGVVEVSPDLGGFKVWLGAAAEIGGETG